MGRKMGGKLPFWNTCFDNKPLFQTGAASQASATFLGDNAAYWPGSMLADDHSSAYLLYFL